MTNTQGIEAVIRGVEFERGVAGGIQ